MLIRIVRLSFQPGWVGDFLELFEETAPQIRSSPGCRHLELWRDSDYEHVFTTYSIWDNEQALNRYRESELFRTTWDKVKVNFSASPEAHSYSRLVESPADQALGSASS